MMDQDNRTWTGARTPWGRAHARTAVQNRPSVPDSEREIHVGTDCTKVGCKLIGAKGMPGAGLTGASKGKAPTERLALKPYWGKPAVRNFREGGGDVLMVW